MSYRDILVTSRLSYGVDTYYLNHPELKLQSLSTPLSEDLKEDIKQYLYRWDKDNLVSESAIDTNPEHLEVVDAYFDADTYTSGTAFRNTNTNEIIVAYSGSNGDAAYENFRTNGTEIFNMRGAMEPAAIEFYRRVKENTGQLPILTGHSQGVKLASTVAIVENVPEAYGFNPAPTFFTEIQNKAWKEFRRKNPTLPNILPFAQVKGLYAGMGEVEYNAESFRTLNSLREGYSGNMTYIASRGDVLSGSVMEGANRQIYLNYVGRWLVLDNAGLHMLDDFFTKESIEKVEAYLNSGREWKTNSEGEITDINGNVIWKRRKTFLPYEQLFYGLYDDAKGRLTSTLKELDNLYSLRLQWQQNGNLTHNQEIYLDYNKIIIITTGLIETLKMQLASVTKISDDFATFANQTWDNSTADIIRPLIVLSKSEVFAVMSEVGVSHQRNVKEPISEIQKSMYKLRTKIVKLETVLEQANRAIKKLIEKDRFLSKMIRF